MTLKECLAQQKRLAEMMQRRKEEHTAAADVLKMGGHADEARKRLKHADECAGIIAMIEATIGHLTSKAKRLAFVPPTIDEIREEMKKHGLPANEATKFEAHYGSNGWRVGGVPMKSWKHAVVKWRETYFERNPGSRKKVVADEAPKHERWSEFIASKGYAQVQSYAQAPEWMRIQYAEWVKGV